MLPVSPDDDRAEGHRYEEAAVTEVFGTDAPALDQHGYLKTHGGIWVEMERAAATAPSRSARFERTRLARRLRGGQPCSFQRCTGIATQAPCLCAADARYSCQPARRPFRKNSSPLETFLQLKYFAVAGC